MAVDWPSIAPLTCVKKHGLRDLPTAAYPDKQGVTLKCTKAQQAVRILGHVHGPSLTMRFAGYQCD